MCRLVPPDTEPGHLEPGRAAFQRAWQWKSGVSGLHQARRLTLSPWYLPPACRGRINLLGAPTGRYDVVARWPGGAEERLTGAFTVTAGSGLRLEAKLVAPDIVRPGRTFTLRVDYANTGDADMEAPLFIVNSPTPRPCAFP